MPNRRYKHEPYRRIDASVPVVYSIVPSTGEEDVRVVRVKGASKHAIVMSIHTIKIAATRCTHGVVDTLRTLAARVVQYECGV